jgi:hypothetical protein
MSICKGTEPSAARSSADARPDGLIVETDTPARLDRLPWGRFHTESEHMQRTNVAFVDQTEENSLSTFCDARAKAIES